MDGGGDGCGRGRVSSHGPQVGKALWGGGSPRPGGSILQGSTLPSCASPSPGEPHPSSPPAPEAGTSPARHGGGSPRSTVYAVLRRHQMSRLTHLDRPTGTPIRYERDRPGELVHIDVKKLGRVPPGGGWRMRGRSTQVRRAKRLGVGYDYVHAAVDDHSRVAYVEVHPDERGETCARFLARAAGFFAEHGVRIEQADPRDRREPGELARPSDRQQAERRAVLRQGADLGRQR